MTVTKRQWLMQQLREIERRLSVVIDVSAEEKEQMIERHVQEYRACQRREPSKYLRRL